MNKQRFQLFTQAVGMIALTLFAIYGLLSAIGIVTPTVSADEVAIGATTVDIDGNNSDARSITAANSPNIPPYFNYEGTLRESDGSLTNGTVGIRAVLYNLATGGSPEYVEDFPNTNVRDGQFNIVLGENPNSYKLFTAFETAPLYMGISLDKDNNGSYETEILPRERVHGVPWSIYAQNAENAFDGVPVGGIVDWWRPVNDDNLFPLPDGFLICDGQTVSDPESPLNGYALPNFQNRFALGTIFTSAIGVTGGQWTHTHTTNSAGSHNHLWSYIDSNKDMWGYNSDGSLEGFSWGDGMDTGGSGYYFFGDELSDIPNYWYTNYSGSHSHTVNSGVNEPPYLAVMKLCRTR